MLFDKSQKLNRAQQHERYFIKHYPDVHKQIIEGCGHSWAENLYLYINECEPHKCPVCGKATKFIGMWKGYNRFCSNACANAQNVDKIAQTKIDRHGTKGYNNRAQARQTSIERYGVDVPSKAQHIRKKLSRPHTEETKRKLSEIYWTKTSHRKKEIDEKRRLTNERLYGSSNIMFDPTIKEKCQQTYINKYGASLGIINKDAALAGIKAKTQKTYPEFIDYVGSNWMCKCPHPECTQCQERMYITDPEIHQGRIKYNSELCTRLLPVNIKGMGTTLELFVRQILDEHNIEHIDNARDIISNKELDIYIPSKKIAIECNGVYWHSTLFKTPKSHYEKFKECDVAGVQLLTLWEDWIKNKPEIIRSIVLNKIGMTPNKIFARKCEIKEVSARTASQFYNINHIQGQCKSKMRLGLYHNNELVAVMAFNKRQALSGSKQLTCDWELIRFANKLNTYVVGGADKLLKHFIKTYKPTKIVSFSSNDISNGHLYKRLGFIKDNESVGYWYIEKSIQMTRYHRSTFTKDSIIRKGLAPSSDKTTWTESEVMANLPYYRIYDSGTTRWVLTITNMDNVS